MEDYRYIFSNMNKKEFEKAMIDDFIEHGLTRDDAITVLENAKKFEIDKKFFNTAKRTLNKNNKVKKQK